MSDINYVLTSTLQILNFILWQTPCGSQPPCSSSCLWQRSAKSTTAPFGILEIQSDMQHGDDPPRDAFIDPLMVSRNTRPVVLPWECTGSALFRVLGSQLYVCLLVGFPLRDKEFLLKSLIYTKRAIQERRNIKHGKQDVSAFLPTVFGKEFILFFDLIGWS